MSVKTRWNITILICLASAYFLLFIPPNLTGAKDPNMLVAFQHDEFAQFPVVLQMTSLGTSLKDTLWQTVVYRHYYYGYPFYLTSAMAILPWRICAYLLHITNTTTAYMLTLRQLSPLFMLAAILLLVYLWTGGTSLLAQICLFLWLSAIPAVFVNNLWWHADSLVTLWVVLTIFSLAQDALRFRPWFYLAAIFCGLATGTKVLGLYFFLSIAVYLVMGVMQKRLHYRAVLQYGSMFFGVMLCTIIIVNPVVFIPGEAQAIFSTLRHHAVNATFDWGNKGPWFWYAKTLKEAFGFWWMYILMVGVCVVSIIYDAEKRLLNILILTWVVPLSLYLLFCWTYQYPRYFIPIFLPLMSCMGNPKIWHCKNCYGHRSKVKVMVSLVILLLCGMQFWYYTRANLTNYLHTLHREQESPAIAFYGQLDALYLSKLPEDVRLAVFRDPDIYVPPLKHVYVKMKWGSADYKDIEKVHPDLILLQRSYIEQYSNPASLISVDPEQALRSYEFYTDAKKRALQGYHQLFETDFGIAFERSR